MEMRTFGLRLKQAVYHICLLICVFFLFETAYIKPLGQPDVREEKSSVPFTPTILQRYPETLVDVSCNPDPEQQPVTAAFDLFAAACLPLLDKPLPEYNAFLAGLNALKTAVLKTPQPMIVPSLPLPLCLSRHLHPVHNHLLVTLMKT